MKTLLPILKTKLFLLGFVSACTVILATTVPQIKNFIAPEKAIGEKIATEQKKIAPKINKKNKTVSSSRVTSGVALEMNNEFDVTVQTDKPDYYPGDFVIITGSGWDPGETVSLHIVSDCGCTNEIIETTADENGNIENSDFEIMEWHIGASFVLTATGAESGLTAQTTFTDSPRLHDIDPITQTGNVCTGTATTVTINYTVNRGAGPNSSGTVNNVDIDISGLPSGVTVNSGLPITVDIGSTGYSGSFILSIDNTVAAGNYDLDLLADGPGNDNATGTGTLEVNPLPVVTCPSNSSVCIDAAPYALTGGSPSGGTYSGAGVSAGNFNPATAGVGPHTITYSYTDGNSCVNTCSYTITVNALPVCSITGPNGPVCPSSSNDYTAPAGMTTYLWEITDGTATIETGEENDQTATVIANAACNTSYTLKLTITNSNSCTSTCTKVVTVVDNTPPTIGTPAANQTVDCGPTNAATLASWLSSNGGASATDVCSGVTWTNNYTALSDLCGETGAATVTFTAKDACNNTSTTSATFTIVDNTPPTIGTPAANQTVDCGPTNAATLGAWLSSNGGASATDVCSGVTWTNNYTALSDLCGETGAATVTFTAKDACNNTSTTSATFTIVDNTPPTIGTPAANQTVDCGPTNAATLASWLSSNGGASATDVCSGVTWTNNYTALSDLCGETGAATVTFTAKDACNNTSTTSATFTIVDNTPPTIGTPAANQTVDCGPTNAATLASWLSSNGGASATDVCSGVTWTNNYTALSDLCGETGAATVTFTAKDACNNTSTTSATFTIVDNTPPTIGTPAANQTVDCGPTNAATLAAWLSSNGGASATDACSGVTWTNNYTALSDLCGETGAATVTFTAKDACNNTSTTSATFTIVDNTPPTIGTPAANQTVDCGPTNAATLGAWLSSNGGASATDVCSGVTWTNNYTALSDLCGETGAATVTFTAKDACNNTSTTSATFTIVDNTPPTIGTPAANQTVDCGPTNAATLASWLSSNGGASATDVCSGVTWTNNYTALSDLCGETGAATVTFTAKDACNNTSTTSATFTIVDNTPPTIGTPAANQTVDCGPTNAATLAAWLSSNGGASATDACSGVTWTNNYTALSDLCGETGAATVTFTAKDACNNTSTTSATFTIVDNTPPTIGTPAANQTVDCGPTNAATLGAWLSSNGGASATDVCSGVTWTNNYTALSDLCGETGAATVTFTAKDACNNTSTTSATFTIVDNTPPTIGTPAANQTVDCDPTNAATLAAWLSSNGGASATDVCSGVTWTNNYTSLSDLCGETGAATVTFTAKDACNNTSTTSATFTIVDNTPPTIGTPAANQTVDCGATNAATLAAWLSSNGGASATDACSGVTWTNNYTALSDLCGETGAATVTFTAKDACNHTSTTSATFTIVDNTAPNAICKNISVTLGIGGSVTITEAQVDNGSNDACDASLNLSLDKYTFTDAELGTATCSKAFTVKLTATDDCGNSAACTSTVTVNKRQTNLDYTGDNDEQYSDHTTLKAVLTDVLTGTGVSGKTITFVIGSQSKTAITNGSGVAETTMQMYQNIGDYDVTASYTGDGPYCSKSVTEDYDILKEDADVDYTGQTFINSPMLTTNVLLTAAINDRVDGSPGNISKAKVKFVVRDYNSPTIIVQSGWLNVSLPDPTDTTKGLGVFEWLNAPVPAIVGEQDQYNVEVIVDCDGSGVGNYKGDDIACLSIFRTATIDFITGGGYVKPTNSLGTHKADNGRKMNFGFNIKFNKSFKSLQGKLNVIYRVGAKIYQVKTNATSSLTINSSNPCSKTAVFTAKANLTDITNPLAPIAVLSGLNLQLKLTDNGEPGNTDKWALSLYNGSTLVLASEWSSGQLQELVLGGGNIVVHSGPDCPNNNTSIDNSITRSTQMEAVPAELGRFNVRAFPNPSEHVFSLVLENATNEKVQIVVYDATGRQVKMFEKQSGNIPIHFGMDLKVGVYVVEVRQGDNRKTLKLVKQ